jgi:hypothetical protein
MTKKEIIRSQKAKQENAEIKDLQKWVMYLHDRCNKLEQKVNKPSLLQRLCHIASKKLPSNNTLTAIKSAPGQANAEQNIDKHQEDLETVLNMSKKDLNIHRIRNGRKTGRNYIY